ncbi:MAG: type II toxin-antitoxin system VapC family toxin [Gammaproteobacteria bacterium]|nr:type II toxin-antitoxin system VapC family toxin [Gammaproteobacteria bacterium]
MILVDTNVVSEVMRPKPSGVVLDWLNTTPTATLYISSISIAEIEFGLQSLPDGQRRDFLTKRFEQFIEQGFEHRTLYFDAAAAFAYGDIMGRCRRAGRPMSILDGQIAAITMANHATLATRNVGDFSASGIDVINPWTEKSGRRNGRAL